MIQNCLIDYPYIRTSFTTLNRLKDMSQWSGSVKMNYIDLNNYLVKLKLNKIFNNFYRIKLVLKDRLNLNDYTILPMILRVNI